MIGNYLKICLRNLMKRKLFSLINVLGLSIGMAVTIVLWTVVAFELSFDKYHAKANSVFRITSSIYSSGEQWAVVGYDLGPALQESIPEIKQFVRRHPFYGGAVVTYFSAIGNPVRFNEPNLQFVDASFLNVFDYSAHYGNLVGSLSRPYTMVMTKSMAEKYFGKDIDPVGKALHISQYGEFQVTAVIDDPPENSHIDVDILLPMENLLNNADYKGANARLENFITYVELAAGVDKSVAESKMPGFLASYLPKDPYTAGRLGNNGASNPVIQFQPITQIHLGDSSGAGQREGGSISTVYFLIVISIFVLGIAWVNYVNLSTARAIERSKEVGIRKVVGTYKSQLMGQFFLESVVVNLISLLLAVLISFPLLDLLNNIMDKRFSLEFTGIQVWTWLISLLVVGSVISGFYPAFVLSSFKVTEVIKGSSRTGHGLLLRKALVVFQFASSLALIVGTFVIYQQIQFMQNRSDEAAGEKILVLNGPKGLDSANFSTQLLSFKNALRQIPAISQVATSDAVPGGGYNWGIHAAKKGAAEQEQIKGQNMEVVFVDPDFLHTYGIKLAAGKNWDYTSATEMKAIIINEASVESFGFGSAQKAVEESMIFNEEYTAPVLGVVSNVHWYSLKNKFTPMVFWPQEVCAGWYSIVISHNIRETITQVEKLFKVHFPNAPFEYYFHDDFFNRQYQSDQRFGRLFSLFAMLAIIIACLGLWGLASFTSAQKVREIGIRKVLGASSIAIVELLSMQFLKLLLLACIVALPVVWIVSDKWLGNFAFRINLSYAVFLFPSMVLLILGMATVSIHTIRAAMANPAQSIRD